MTHDDTPTPGQQGPPPAAVPGGLDDLHTGAGEGVGEDVRVDEGAVATATRPGTRAARRRELLPALDAVVRRSRDLLATAVLTAGVLAALALALGAVLVGLSANTENTVVGGILDLARWLDGPFADVFVFDSRVKQTLVNWAIAAGVYLVAARVVERLLRPERL